MNRQPTPDREHVNRLMMAALDGEISVDEQRELDGVLAAHPDIRKEFATMRRVKEVTGTMAYREPPEELWDTYWTSVYNRFERGVGWILVSVGAVVISTYGVWKWVEALWGDQDIPLLVRVSILALAAGLLLLLLSVIREKLFTWRRDPYKEIQR